jgi:hypothetical protein
MSQFRHVAFGLAVEGTQGGGVAGMVSKCWWPELAHNRRNKLGDAVSYETPERTYHALVCFSYKLGWSLAGRSIQEALDSINMPDTDEIAVVAIGTGTRGLREKANFYEIIGGMARSDKRVVLFYME